MSEFVKDEENGFLETMCKIEFEGKELLNNGSYILRHAKTGKKVALMYAYYNENKVGTWDGSIKVPAYYGRKYRSFFGDLRQTVYFKMNGTYFIGIYFFSGSSIVRAKEISEKSYKNSTGRR